MLELDPRASIVYFDLMFETANFEEDLNDPEGENYARADRLRGNELAQLVLEAEALGEAAALLGRSVMNEGHDTFGALVCKLGVSTVADVRSLQDLIQRNVGGGNDHIYLNAPYQTIGNFVLWPQGVNRPSVEFCDWDEWLEEHSND